MCRRSPTANSAGSASTTPPPGVAHPVLWTHLCLGCDGLLKVISPGLSRRSVPQFLDQPLLVVLLDEVPHSVPHLFDVLKNPSIDGLLFQGAIEPLCDSVGFRLTDKRKTGIDAPILGLVLKVEVDPEGEDRVVNWMFAETSFIKSLALILPGKKKK